MKQIKAPGNAAHHCLLACVSLPFPESRRQGSAALPGDFQGGHMSQSRILQCAFLCIFALIVFTVLAFPIRQDIAFDAAASGRASAADMTPEERGLWNLQHKPYGTALPLNKKTLESLVKVWEPEWKAKINTDDPDSIRKVAFERYGFSEATWDNQGAPLQFVSSQTGGWTQNCMLCHGGRVPVSGESKIGMPNTELDMQTLYDDATSLTKMRGPFQLTFGMSRGRTNAFIFSLELLRRRNEDLSRRAEPAPMGDYADFDLDAPPWWYLKKKTALYVDAGVKG